MAAPKYLHPHVSSSITDLSQVFVTAPGSTMLYCVSSADRGPDNTPTLITSESELLFYFGEPNSRKHGQAMYNAVNWLRSGGLVVFTRVLPYLKKAQDASNDYEVDLQSANYATMVVEIGLQVKNNYSDWAAQGSGTVPYRYLAVRTRTLGGDVHQPLVDSEATKAKNKEKLYRTTKTLDAEILKDMTAFSSSSVVGYEIDDVFEDDGTTAVSSTSTEVQSLYGLFNTHNVAIVNNDGLKFNYAWYPLLYFRGKDRGAYYNNFGVTLKLRSDDDETYDFRTYDLHVYKDATTILEGPFVVSLYPEATDNSGASLFIEDVLNTYSSLIRCKMNEDNYDKICEYISGVNENGDTSVWQKMDVFTLKERDVDPSETVHKAARIAKPFKRDGNKARLVSAADQSEEIGIHSGLTSDQMSSLEVYSSVILGGGTDGRWGASTIDSNITNDKNTLIQRAYEGTEDSINETTGEGEHEIFFSEIKKKDKYPIDVILDSNHIMSIKKAISELSVSRGDCVSFLDVGFTASPRQALNKRIKSGSIEVNQNTFYTSIFVQDFVVYDSFTGRDIRVTPTYFLAQKIPQNDDTFGMHIPFVGPRRGTITGFKEMSWAPDAEYREQLYKAKLNYIEFDEARGLTAFMMQTTSQSINSALSDINHVRTLLRIRRDVENMMKDYRFEVETSPSWETLQYSLNNYLEQYRTNGALTSVSAALVASDYDLKQRLMRVQIQMTFSAVIERLFADITVQR